MSGHQASENSERNLTSKRLTPYHVMRMQNCKTFKFRKGEMYPTIRPPVSQCSPVQTALWLSDKMEADCCEKIDPQLFQKIRDNPYVDNVASYTLKRTGPAHDYQPQNCRQRDGKYRKIGLDWSRMTPYELMRMHNCKTFNFQKCEAYPSIRPPASKCDPAQTVEWLADAIEDNGCDRFFDMEKDDVVQIWKQTPNKDTLGYYGVGSGVHQPEAIIFNQVISKCLDKARVFGPEASKVELPKSPPKRLKDHKYTTGPCGSLVLNRQLLESKIVHMPTVKRKLNASNALNWLHCPRSKRPGHPFTDEDRPKVALRGALNMERPATRPKHGLRRKHMFCELQCGIAENMCTDYEWKKYKEDPVAYDKAFQMEMEQLIAKSEPEPRNYEELYSHLVSCFEKHTNEDPLCEAYRKCCMQTLKVSGPDDSGGGPGPHGQGPAGERPSGHKPHIQTTIPSDTDDDGASGDGTQPDKDKKKKEGKEKTDKEKAEKEKSEKEKSEKEKPDRDESKKPGRDKKTGGDKKEGVTGGDKKADEQKSDDQPSDKPAIPSDKKEKISDKPPSKVIDDHETAEGSDGGANKDKIPKKPHEKPIRKPTGDKHPPKQDPRIKKPHKPDGYPPGKEHIKDCPCEVCEFMERRKREEDTPLIRQMKQEEKRRQLRDYYKRMCHREYLKWGRPEYRAPQHKCDQVVCDNCFCQNPKLGEYCDCLDAMQQLHKLLGPKHCIVKNELLFNVEDIRRRLCQRFCECL